MSLASNISNLAVRIGTEFKSLRTMINGNVSGLTALTTTNKTNLVAAINELQSSIATLSSEGAGIDDNGSSGTVAWSAAKIIEELGDLKAEILGGAGSAYDTLQELKAFIDANEGSIDTLLAALENRVRFDEAQTLTAPQKTQALANIGAAPETHTHTAATTGAAGFMSAADKTKLDGVAAGANNYIHPTTDGNRHVPATTGSDINKVLKSAGTAGSAPSWATLAKADVGLANVDNTSDANKPVSTAQATALAGKSDVGHLHDAATTSVAGFMSAADKTKLDGVATGANNYVHPTGDGNRHVPATGTGNNGRFLKAGATAASEAWAVITKADVGLANVDNTSDLNKPVSTATQTALDLKASNVDVGDVNTNFVTVFEGALV